MAIELGYTVLQDIFQNTTIFGISWLPNLIASFITIVLLTRDTNEWKNLGLPVVFGWHLAGLTLGLFSIVILPILGIIYVLHNLGITKIGNLINIRTKPKPIMTINRFNQQSKARIPENKQKQKLLKKTLKSKKNITIPQNIVTDIIKKSK